VLDDFLPLVERVARSYAGVTFTLPVVLSDRAMRQLASVKHARQDHEQACHREPSSEELVERTGYTHDQLDSLMCVELCPRSLEEQLQGEDGAAGTLADLFADPRAEDGYDTVERELDADALRHMPNDLGDRERAVLRARYGFDGAPQMLQAVGSTVLSQVVAEYAEAAALDSEADRLGA
jgi:RNA polymerase primary sigma factor